MTEAPTFEDIFAVMSSASVGDTTARVALPASPQLDDTATKFALALNVLLDDLALKAEDAQHELAERGRIANRFKLLSDASREFSAATDDLNHLLDLVARRLGQLLGDMCAIRPVSTDGQWLETTGGAYHGDPELLAATRELMLSGRQRVGEGISGRVAATGEALLIPKIDPDAFLASSEPRYRPLVARLQATSSIVLPLVCRGTVVGVANLLRNSPDHPYDEDDLHFVQSVADHAALAIGNARSYAAERAARDAAEKATARFARLRDAGILGTIVIEGAGHVIEVNDTLLQLVGYSRDEILSGRVAWSDLTPPEWRDLDARAVEQLATSGIASPREKEFIRKDGKRIPVLAGSAMLGGETTECISFVLDLTERKEAQRGRRDAERRSQRMVESALVGMWMLDAENKTTFMNARMANILGMDVAEAMAMPLDEFFVEDDRAVAAERLASRRQGLASAHEQRFRRRDGSIALLAIESSPMYDAQGRFDGVLGVAADITERRRTEDALRASEDQYRNIVETTSQGIWVIDVNGKTTFANRKMAEILGCNARELIGVSPAEFFDEEGRAIFARHSETRRGGHSAQSEIRLLAKDGAKRWIIVESSPIKDASGKYQGAFAVVMDVTERRDAQEALRESEARYRRLAESGLVGIIVTEERGRIVEANDTFLSMLGYSRSDLGAGLVTWGAITPADWSQSSAEAGEQLRLHGLARPWEKEYLRKDGSRVPVLVGVATLDGTKNISLSIDLTERKQAEAGRLRAEDALRHSEEQLRQSQKMEAVGRLAGGVAHDFNNVLSVILSYSEMLLADKKPDDPTRAEIEEIHRAGQRAADLTRQLLMFSRQQVLAPKVLDLNDVLTSMHKMLGRVLGADVDLVSLPTQPLRMVRADRSSVEQIIMNLVVNARDAMPTGGKLTMETQNVVLDEAYAQAHLGVKPGPHVMLAVSDTGTGIEKATMERIFEPFFTTKASGKGTGLGLSTVFGIAQQSGGSVWVYSEVGRGTTFKVYLPCVDAPVDVAQAAVPRTTLRGSETILLVEDDEQVRGLVRSILRRSGYLVIEASNAREALLSSEQHAGRIHLLLSDVVMPQMSGPELAKRLAIVRPDMKVLCMSGYTDDSIVRHGVLEARIAFLQKPITPEALTMRVREVLDEAPPSN